MNKDQQRSGEPSKNYFVLQKWIFKIIGLSLSPKRSTPYKIYSFLMVILVTTYLLFAFPDNFKHQNDFDAFANNILFSGGFVAVSTKHIIMYVRRAKILEIMQTLENGKYFTNFKYLEPAETILIKNCVQFTRKQTVIFAALGVLTITTCDLVSYIAERRSGEHSLALGTVTILTDHFNLEIIRYYQSFMFLVAAVGFVTEDVIYASIISHICVQCQILENFIRRMIKIGHQNMVKDENIKQKAVENIEPSTVRWEYLQNLLKEAVRFHIAILNISEEAEDVFNVAVLAEFTSLSVSFGFVIYQVSVIPISDYHFMKYVIVLMCAIFPLFMSSYWGNEILVESQAIADACYEVNFIGADIRFQKGLMLIMLRSQKPITLTLGKFSSLSLVTMLSFCRAYFSYYMFISKMNST